jgi:hypothetical protein
MITKIHLLGDVDLLAMMTERDRTKLRLLLAEYKLLFLIPKYREEQYLYEERGTFIINYSEISTVKCL